MAALADQDRADCSDDFQRVLSFAREPLPGILRSDIRAAINAIDDFLVTNAAAVNNAFPAATKNNLTTAQKARLVAAVTLKRFVKGGAGGS